MKQIKAHLELLGFPVKDRVTGFKGVVVSVSFDLYGCVQAVVNPGVNKKEQKIGDAHWFDVKRLEKTSDKRAMDMPTFFQDETPQAAGRTGAASKSLPHSA